MLERAIVPLMKPLPDCLLYAFIDTAYLGARSPEEIARQLADGGADLVQLRAKGSPIQDVRRMADRVAPILRDANVGFVINDHLSVARASGADFCHLGQEDFFDAGHKSCSELLQGGERIKIGLSTHAPSQAQRAFDAGADYVAIGPVYATPTKAAAAPVTLDYVRWASINAPVPWFAIGGINETRLPEVIEAGARRVCVVSAILQAPDVRKACQRFKDCLLSAAN